MTPQNSEASRARSGIGRAPRARTQATNATTALEVLDQPRRCEAGRILHQPVNVVILAVARDERGAKVGANLAEDLAQIGNVNAIKLVKTRMAKSVLDASWSTFRHQLRYQAGRHGARYVETDERNTSATCSACGCVEGPKGIAGLRMRSWVCCNCGVGHDRDLNAAVNILRRAGTSASC